MGRARVPKRQLLNAPGFLHYRAITLDTFIRQKGLGYWRAVGLETFVDLSKMGSVGEPPVVGKVPAKMKALQ
jgi:hypothetical protein